MKQEASPRTGQVEEVQGQLDALENKVEDLVGEVGKSNRLLMELLKRIPK